ncbi:hypothetical protein Gpo141_00014474, partial [Globisporangium polare]
MSVSTETHNAKYDAYGLSDALRREHVEHQH